MKQRTIGGERYLLLTLVVCCVTSARPVLAQFETPTAITNVKIVVTPGTIIESGTILLSEGRIVAAGTDVAIPPHAEVIDGKDLIAYPGFIDGQIHLGIPSDARSTEERERAEDLNPDTSQGPLSATRAANRIGVRPEFRAVELYTGDDKQLKSHRSAGFTTALIAPRDGIFSGTSDLISLSGKPIRRSVIASNVAMHGGVRTGESGVYPRSLLGIVAQYRQVLLDAGWYVKARKYAQRNPTNGHLAPLDPALEALQPLLGRKTRYFFEANSEREIRRAVKLADEFGLDLGITGAREAWKVIDLIKEKRIPLVVSVKFPTEPEYGKKKPKKKSAKKPEGEDEKPDDEEKKPDDKKKEDEKKIYEPLKVRKEQRRLWEEQVENLIRLHEAGVPFTLRTKDFDKLADFWKNVRLVTKRGLPDEAVVAALTTAPAELFGVQSQLGSIQPGRLANVTLMTKPLSDKKAKVKMVFIDGIKFEVEKDKKSATAGGGGSGGPGRFAGRRGGRRAPDSQIEEEEEAEEEEESQDVEASETEKEDKGPTFASEIEADRVPETKTGGSVLIRNATIIPITSPTLTNASILIRDGKIEAIGDIPNVPAGVTVIDGTGRFVIPGLVDAHSHLGTDGTNEGGLSISAEVRIADLINPTSVGLFRAVAGGVTTHHVMHGSANPIGGQNAIVKIKYGTSAQEMLMADAPRTIKFALGENVTRANRSRGTTGARRFPGSRMGVEAVIRDAMETAKGYQADWDEFKKRSAAGEDVLIPRRDLRLDALADILRGDLTVHSHCYRSDEILRLLAVAEDYGFRIGTLQHVLEGYRIAPEIARHGAGASTFSNFWAYKVEAFGAIPHNAALMTNHGINVSINSDSANTIRYFGQEAAKSVKWGGLNENEALRLVTINPAMQLQIDDRVGSLEVGKDGDVAIFNGHPLNTFSKCVMTLIEGEVYFEDDLPETTEPASAANIPGPVDRTIPETPHRAYAIVGATVHPISGPVIENGTVVIIEDKITAVGVGATVPPGAGVIDAAGLHVYPGLIDAGGNLGLTEIGQTPVTTDSSDIARFAPHLRAASAVHPHSRHIHIARTAGTTTALTRPSGGQISGQSAVIHLDGWTADEMMVVDRFGLHMSVPIERTGGGRGAGRRFGRRPTGPPASERKKNLENYIAKAKRYAKAMEAAESDPTITFEVDLALEAMAPYVRGEKPVVFSASSYQQIVETVEFAEKQELKCIIAGGQDAWKAAELLAEKDIPVLFSGPLGLSRGNFELWDGVYRAAGVMDRAGVEFCFATNSASGAFNLAIQAGMAVAHGLPRERAEYALTLGAAKILGIDDRTGSIEPGKLADLIVTTHTPLQTVSQVTHMFIAGRPVELTSMHTESYEKFKNRPEPDLPPLPELKGPPNLTTR